MLTTSKPTPTTVLYTVSTRSPSNSLPTKALRITTVLLRLLAGLLVLILLLHECNLTLASAAAHPLRPPRVAHMVSLPIPQYQRLLLCVTIIWLASRRGHMVESLLVIRGLGVQTTTSGGSYLLWGNAGGGVRFIPSSSIQDVWIHEAFHRFEVRYYLCIVVEGEEDVVVVFSRILPRREILEQVWRGARACLYEPKA